MTGSKQPEKRAVPPGLKCPICGRDAVVEYRPFCSRRCADIDLSRWLKGVYAIPGTPDAEEDESPARPDAIPGLPEDET